MQTKLRVVVVFLGLFAMMVLTGCDASNIMDKINNIIGRTNPGTATPQPQPQPEPQPAPAPLPPLDPPSANATPGEKPDANACVVTVYGNDSCPYCVKAKNFLKAKGVMFVDKNINTDPAAKKELQAKAQAKGMQISGIPVIDVCGDMVKGFNQAMLEELLKKHGLLGGQAPAPVAPAPAPAAGATNECRVTLYGTSSCSWCTKAKAYLDKKCVTYVYKDLGKDPAASKEMQEKAAAKGLTPRGVPVIDICGDMVLGYSEAQIDQLLQKHGFTGCPVGVNAQKDDPGL